MDQEDAYLAKVLTEKGQAFIETAGWDESLDAADIFEANKKAAESKIVSTISTDNLKSQDILSLHSASFWEDVSFACLNCGTCTYRYQVISFHILSIAVVEEFTRLNLCGGAHVISA